MERKLGAGAGRSGGGAGLPGLAEGAPGKKPLGSAELQGQKLALGASAPPPTDWEPVAPQGQRAPGSSPGSPRAVPPQPHLSFLTPPSLPL